MTPTPPTSIGSLKPYTLRKGSILHRIVDMRFAENNFNPCLGRPTRFAPIHDANGQCIPSLYAADTFDCVVFETIFHDVPIVATPKVVRVNTLEGKGHAILKTKRALKFAPLFAPELKKLGVERKQLIDTTARWYTITAQWAAAIHAQHKHIEGLVWTSRQCDPNRAFLLFGDRVSIDDLEVERGSIDLSQSPQCMRDIRKLGQRAGIVLVV